MGVKRFISKAKKYASLYAESFVLHDKEPSEIVTIGDERADYARNKSFTDFLPYQRYDSDNQVFEFDDGKSYAAIFDLYPAEAEGMPLSSLASVRDGFMSVLTQTIEQHYTDPWVLQCYQSDTLSLVEFQRTVREYVTDRAKDSQLAASYIPMVEKHLSDVCKPGGLFTDKTVTDGPWRGAIRNCRIVLYRKYSSVSKVDQLEALREVTEMRERVEAQLSASRIRFRRVNGAMLYDWLVRWFNPSPSVTGGDVDEFLRLMPYPGDDSYMDFSDSLMITPPRTDAENGVVWFDEMPHKAISVIGLRAAPSIGTLTAPKLLGDRVYALADRMPEGTQICITVVLTAREDTENHFKKIQDSAKAESMESQRVQSEIGSALTQITYGNTYYPTEATVFIREKSLDALKKAQNKVISQLTLAQLQPINVSQDLRVLGTYRVSLPMNYQWSHAKSNYRWFYATAQHIANLCPILGRGRGTGLPGILGFNRGGEPVSADPLSLRDRNKNSHMMIFGPTGAGKSSTLVAICLWYAAIYDPRFFVVEAGNSFGLVTAFLKSEGKSVFSARMTANSSAVVPPFANAFKALEQSEADELAENDAIFEVDVVEEIIQQVTDGTVEDEENIERRDYLGEMEIVARIMVSGGDKEEAKKVKLAHQQLLKRAILNAARSCRARGVDFVLTEDVAKELELLSTADDVPAHIKPIVYEYAAAMRHYTTGTAGRIFNRKGKLWPDVDWTHIDLAEFVSDSRSAELAVLYISIISRINEFAERDQNTGRPIIFLTDEAHLITKNPLLSPAVVKIVKMWRKLGASMWLATQNMEDFPDEAAVMLSLCEWWLLLAMDPNQVESVAAFKHLDEIEEALLRSTKKQSKSYTEGILMGSKGSYFMRFVPPSIVLSFGNSEPDEKRERSILMKHFNVTELDAAILAAARVDYLRGIENSLNLIKGISMDQLLEVYAKEDAKVA